jgi:dTMP kinase
VKGLLITLEGIDGSGKSTAARHIASRLCDLMPEQRLVFTAEPTNSEAGKILRAQLSQPTEDSKVFSSAMVMEELFLFMADHADHLAKLVDPSLKEGAIVISDRYADSTAAYQGVTLRGIVPDPVQWIRSIYSPWNLPPDRTLLFALDPSLALQRLRSRKEQEKFERLGFLQEVDSNFQRLARQEPERFVLIDASVDAELAATQALQAILDLISKRC